MGNSIKFFSNIRLTVVHAIGFYLIEEYMKTYLLYLAMIICSQFASAQSQVEMNRQAREAYDQADAEMTVLYRKVMSSLSSPDDRAILLEAQRAWIKYKEAHCKGLANFYEGGSIQPLIRYSCLEGLTRERIAQLNKYIEN